MEPITHCAKCGNPIHLTKEMCAKALGRYAAGKPKKYSREEKDRRRARLAKARQKRHQGNEPWTGNPGTKKPTPKGGPV